MARIAVVGSGISGLTAAYKLSKLHEVHLLEKNSKLGGTPTHIKLKLKIPLFLWTVVSSFITTRPTQNFKRF